MGASFTYLKLEIKRTCKILPYFLTGATVLALLLGTVAFLAGKTLYGQAALSRITVGVVLPEGDAVAKMAVSMLGSLESVESLCDFQYMDAEKAREKLKNGELYALMEVPEGLVRDIMNGVNSPVEVTFPRNAGLEPGVFKELADAGARTVSVAQAAIYAGGEFCTVHSMADSIPSLERSLNQIFLKYALPRGDYFKSFKVSASGDVSVAAYYGVSLSVLFLLLCGIPASAVLRPESRVFQGKLRILGIGRYQAIAFKTISSAVLLFLAGGLILAGCVFLGAIAPAWQMAPVLALLSLAVSAFVVFIYELAGSLTAGVMLLFLTAVGMTFLSGGFIPAVFLPESVRRLSGFMPSTLLIRLAKGLVTGEFSMGLAGAVILMGLAFYGGAVWIRRTDE